MVGTTRSRYVAALVLPSTDKQGSSCWVCTGISLSFKSWRTRKEFKYGTRSSTGILERMKVLCLLTQSMTWLIKACISHGFCKPLPARGAPLLPGQAPFCEVCNPRHYYLRYAKVKNVLIDRVTIVFIPHIAIHSSHSSYSLLGRPGAYRVGGCCQVQQTSKNTN